MLVNVARTLLGFAETPDFKGKDHGVDHYEQAFTETFVFVQEKAAT